MSLMKVTTKPLVQWLGILFLTGGLMACSAERNKADYRIIPLPGEIIQTQGKAFVVDENITILYPDGNKEMENNAAFLASYIKDATGNEVKQGVGTKQDNAIVLELGLDTENPEAYQLVVTNKGVTISASTAAGVFYGIQTLRKSLPVVQGAIELPAVTINDAPRFAYRGMMLDVSRHFATLDSVKRYIDILAMHNINRFHWHLSDDQGWRIEIKKYPELTTIGSMRKETVIGHNTGKYDGKPYGGFYTQQQAKEIVEYAKDRYITVIPEIDLPGHMQAALKAYPHLGCTGGPYEVWTQWGVSEDVLCAGNDKTYEFIGDVLDEIVAIFPSEYIHVGGDECPKVRWEKCPKCQAKIRTLGLKASDGHSAEERLQSHVISYAGERLAQRGRKMIGWDEILEGGLAPGATVMSWRGVEGAISAAKQGHDAIMTPSSHLYFDYYQAEDRESEPMAIGGYIPIERVYGFEPMPSQLTPEQQKHIIGVQANLWREYIPTFSHVEYMILPRTAALAEVQWTQPDKKDYTNFLTRIPHLLEHYNLYNYNYARHLNDVDATFVPSPQDNALEVTLYTPDGSSIYYTTDGSEPTQQSSRYESPFKIKESCTLKAIVFRSAGNNSRLFSETIAFNKASLKPIQLLQPSSRSYTYQGASLLNDGLRGDNNYKTGRWIGFNGTDLEALIDLGQETEIKEVLFSACVEKGDWILTPRGIKVDVSADGKEFKPAASEEYGVMAQDDHNGLHDYKLDLITPIKTRYVKVTILSEHAMPQWHSAAGRRGHLFVDEIVIN